MCGSYWGKDGVRVTWFFCKNSDIEVTKIDIIQKFWD